MNRFTKTAFVAIMLLFVPMKHQAQLPQFNNNPATIEFNITDIAVFDERIFFMHNLLNDNRFDVINSERDGIFLISADEAYQNLNLEVAFDEFRTEIAAQFAQMDKYDATETALLYKTELPNDIVASLMMDFYVRSRTNNTCATSDPFCTDNGMYQFPAGVNAGSGESGPYYSCLYSTPNPAWYHMRIANPGSITIHMSSSPSHDIDFCCWGPFTDPTTPCPNGLTANKVVSCSYSASATENCIIPATAQTGDYFILVITNYSNSPCNISFSKTAGNGTTDCGIMPPVVDNNGPYCVGQTIQLTANGQAGASYSWSGPGGFTSNQQNPTRPNCTMAMAGTYTCTISLGGQTNSASTDVVVYPQPTANFNFTTVCQGEPTQFTSTSTTNPAGQNITSYQWNFGDGSTSTQQNPSHQYANAGSYQVTLTVGCGNNTCTHAITYTVTVETAPIANAGPDQTIGYGGTAQLSGSGGAGTFNYHWEPANKVVNANAQNTQTISLTADQTYTLTVTNPQGGCTSTDEVTIHINGSAMTASASASPSSICQGFSTQLTASAGGGTGTFTYSWTPTTGLSNPNIYNPVATPTQTTTYTCHVSDGQTTQNVTVTVTVNLPEFTEETVYICPDDEYTWHGQVYSNIGDYEYHTTTAQGCEKTITLHLRHYPTYDETTINAAVCFGESYNFFGTVFDYPISNYPHTLQTVHGCDSIVRLNLTVYDDNGTTLNEVSVCPGQLPYHFYGVDYYENTDVTVWDTDIHGCDSAVRLVLSVSDYYMPPIETKHVCYTDTPSYDWNPIGDYHFILHEDGLYTDTLPTSSCEGIFRLDLHFQQVPEIDYTEVVACDRYTWPMNGQTYTQSGDYYHSISLAPFPCEQVYQLHLTINNSSTSEFQHFDSECNVVSYPWFGETILFKRNCDTLLSGLTPEGCLYEVHVQVTNMLYTPEPEIRCSDINVEFPHQPITATEFNVNRYTYFASDPKSDGTWYNNQCEWSISKESWRIVPSADNRSCTVYAMDWVEDTIWLTFKAVNHCSGTEGISARYWLKPSFYGIEEQEAYPAAVSVIPNPNNGQMELRFENMDGKINVRVCNANGALVDSFEVQATQAPYSYNYAMKRLANGVYFFIFNDGKRSVTKKVVIIH